MADLFDRTLGALDGLPDVLQTKPTTIRTVTPLTGNAQTHIVQTVRQKDVGDTVFLEGVSVEGTVRIVLPPKVTTTIAAQSEALGARARSRAAKATAAARKAAGHVPFVKKEK